MYGVAIAKVRFSDRAYLRGAGECLPFEDESFDPVISAVALVNSNFRNFFFIVPRLNFHYPQNIEPRRVNRRPCCE